MGRKQKNNEIDYNENNNLNHLIFHMDFQMLECSNGLSEGRKTRENYSRFLSSYLFFAFP